MRALAMIGALYVSQGLPMGLAFMALPAIFRKLGFSTEAIGMMGVIILPWALKFLWAPFVDRGRTGRLGRRKRWIIPAQIALAGLYAVLAIVAERELSIVAVIALLGLANLVSATQDIATDGWTVELLRGPYLGWANGLQIGGFALGMLIGGSVTVSVFDHGGWASAFGLLAGLTLLSILPVAMVRETPSADRQAAEGTASRPSLRHTLRRPGAWSIISVAALFHFAATMVNAMLGPFLVDSGLSLADVGIIMGAGIASIALCGGIAGGLITKAFGARRTAIVSGFAAAASLLLWAAAAAFGGVTLAAAAAIMSVTGLAGGIAYVAFFTIFMEWASLRQAGTDFTVLQCTESCTNILASAIAGSLAFHLGFAGLFVTATAVAVVAMAWILAALTRLSDTSRERSTVPAAATGQ